MIRRHRESTLTDPLLPYTTLVRSTDDRRVADPAVALVGHPAGRGAGGQVALAVQGQGTDGAEVFGDLRLGVGLPRGVLLQGPLQLLPAPLGAEIGRIDLLHAPRSEEHTSELQSLMRISYAVFCLQKKKKP